MPYPEALVKRSRSVMARRAGTVSSSAAVGLDSTRRLASSGSHSSTLWSSPRNPDSTSRTAAVAVITLVIDWIRMIASCRIGPPSIDATPAATTSTSPDPRTATAPGMVPASTWRTSRSSSAVVTLTRVPQTQQQDRLWRWRIRPERFSAWHVGFGESGSSRECHLIEVVTNNVSNRRLLLFATTFG
jgi:hypothetical protein